jgi:hypothetical protein
MNNVTYPKLNIKLYLLLFTTAVFTAAVFSNCTPRRQLTGESKSDQSRKLLLRDEGLSQLSYIDIANPKANWFMPVPCRSRPPSGRKRTRFNWYRKRL